MKKCIVITTIHEKTRALSEFESFRNWHLIVAGDVKSRPIPSSGNLTFLPVERQAAMDSRFQAFCPFHHYGRKNLGYIHAIRNGAEWILDTDDDNIPYPDWQEAFDVRPEECERVRSPKFVNIYRFFSNTRAWPRGFPLDRIHQPDPVLTERGDSQEIAILQGLADKDPDVDAIHRMVFPGEISFRRRNPVLLDQGVYCPFNSQNTMWRKDAFVYLYLPVTVSFRFTDILRGYVAQRGIWSAGKHLAFVRASVFQDRNEHDLMKDFESEVECYLSVQKTVELLDAVDLTGDPFLDIAALYRPLADQGVVADRELESLDAWLQDVAVLRGSGA